MVRRGKGGGKEKDYTLYKEKIKRRRKNDKWKGRKRRMKRRRKTVEELERKRKSMAERKKELR